MNGNLFANQHYMFTLSESALQLYSIPIGIAYIQLQNVCMIVIVVSQNNYTNVRTIYISWIQ